LTHFNLHIHPKTCDNFGEGTLFIVINGRVDFGAEKGEIGEEESVWFRQDFRPVFHYAPPTILSGEDAKKELLLFFEFGKSDSVWTLAEQKEKPKGFAGAVQAVTSSAFSEIWKGNERPGPTELANIF
jgi:hypothetical protein